MSRLINAEAQELAELAAVLAEGARLSRGRQYQKRGQVTDLMVEPEAVTASVHGSRDEPYDVTIACKAAGQNELRRPIFRKTAEGGHFGRDLPEFTWESTKQAAVLAEKAGIAATT